MAWKLLKVRCRYPEFAEELLAAHGAQSVTFVDARDRPVLEPAPGETPLWEHTEVVGLFPEAHDLAPVTASLRACLEEGRALAIEQEDVPDQEWIRVWLEGWHPRRFGDRLWVGPRDKPVAGPGTVAVLLDPGLAFGTGAHPSTALCLEWLACTPLAGRPVLDYGCGSGLLAIAALKLGASRAVGVDIDPQALTAARENAAVNAVDDRFRAVDAADFHVEPFQVVVSNILANSLIELAPRLIACLAAGGRIALAGLLEAQAQDVMAVYRGEIAFDPPLKQEGWTLITGTRRTAA